MYKKIKELLFNNISTRQKVAKNTFWLTVSNFGGRLLRAIIIIYAARILGAAGWGAFNYAITLAAFLTLFGDLGINVILTREIPRAKNDDERRLFISTAFQIKLAFLILVGFSIVTFAPRIATLEAAKPLYPIVAFIFAFDMLREFGFAYLKGIERMEGEAFLYLLTNAAIVVSGLIFLSLKPSVMSFTAGYAVGAFVGATATFWVLRKKFQSLFSKFSLKLAKYILAASWPLAMANFMGVFLTNTDILILGWFRSAEDIGFYSAALRIIQFLYLIPAIMAMSAFPIFSRLVGRDEQKMRGTLERVVSLTLLIAIPLSVGGIILAPQIIAYVFSSAYLPAAPSFQILLLTLAADFSMNILAYAALAYNHQKILMVYTAIAASLNVVFDLLFIPRWGITGSAWATFIAQVTSIIYLWRSLKRLNRFEILPRLKSSIFATGIMAMVVVGLKLLSVHVLLAIGAGVATYLGILVLLREPLLNEIKKIVQPTSSTLSPQNGGISQ